MHSYTSAFSELKDELCALYDQREAAAIAHEILNHITGLSKVQRLIDKHSLFTTEQHLQFLDAKTQLLCGVPLQYVTGTAWFLGRPFIVSNSVLIPRPETEELVQWVVTENPGKKSMDILEVGTGSGCIAISLKLAMPDATITSCDISGAALQTARKNANILHAAINFLEMDFLDSASQNKLGMFDVIVSNPPYIPILEKERLHTNVRDNEPALALFVPDNDALVFYRAIAQFGKKHLNPGGKIYCELDAAHAEECRQLFENEGYWDVTKKMDMFDNWRFISANIG